MSQNNKTLGQIAFEAYKKNVKSLYSLVDWHQLTPKAISAWQKAAEAAVQAFLEGTTPNATANHPTDRP